MFTEKDLKELLEYKSEHPLISLYLNTDPMDGSTDAYKLRMRNMLKEIDYQDDLEAIERYFDHEYDWSGRSVAVFSCAEEDYLRTYSFQVPLRDRLRISHRPHVKPLADLLDSYGGYGVAVVDKQGARLFYFHLGELREQEGVVGETVRRTKRGGGSQALGRRGGVAGQTNYSKEVAERNIRDSAEFASRFFAENNVRRVLIGGTEDNLATFRSQLPKSWQSLIVGTFPMSMNASHEEVKGKALEIGRQAESRRESQLLQAVITAAAKGRGGVVNLDDTLSAVHEGRVQTLIIREGLRAPGYRCLGCGYLTAQKVYQCPFCGNKFEHISDAVELAVRQVMLDGGDVEVIHEVDDRFDFDGIGALLRY
jgi:peptide chain release factor subunit 1